MVDHSSLTRTYHALADPSRLTILARLRDGEARISDLADLLPQTLAGVSKHVQVLEAAGLVGRRRSGRDHWISLRSDQLESATTWLEELRPFWEGRLQALESYLDELAEREATEQRDG